MPEAPCPRYQIGIALRQDRVAVLAHADCFALAQAQQLVIAQLLRDGAWPVVLVIVRVTDGAVLERQLVGDEQNA